MSTVRWAGPADEDGWLVLRRLMFADMGTPADRLDDRLWQDEARAWFRARVGGSDVRVALAEDGGRVVAGCTGEVTVLIPSPSCPNGRCGLLSTVATLPEARGRGLASACTDAVLAWFVASTDVTRVDLFATPEGARIYAARGFTRSDFPAMRWPVERPAAPAPWEWTGQDPPPPGGS